MATSNSPSTTTELAPDSNTQVTAVIVTYAPDLPQLGALLERLLPQVQAAVLVDNGSDDDAGISELLQAVGQATGVPVTAILNPENRGIAAAQNQGISLAMETGADAVILSDQDSLPEPDMVAKLQRCLDQACAVAASGAGAPVAAVGPVPVEVRAGDDTAALVYSYTKWGPRRRSIPPSSENKDVPFVLASGCLIPAEVLRHVGPMNQSLFIDHVDLAWCLRAVSMGYRILVCGNAHLEHSLGEHILRLPTGREVHVQSQSRNYYMVRNTLFLINADFMGWRWKVGYLEYLAKYLAFYSVIGVQEPGRFGALLSGIRDGLIGRGGPRP